jgi:hypothetical protein
MRFALFVVLIGLELKVNAYNIPFSVSESAEMVNKVCLYPCKEIGLDKGTKVTVDFTLKNADHAAQGERFPRQAPQSLSDFRSIRHVKAYFFRCIHFQSIH